MMNTIKDKVIIITGASSGIGAAVARRLAREGARLALAARREDRLQQVAADAQALGAEVLILPTDVRRQEDIQRMVQAVLERWGRIDILFNNAGVGNDDALVKTKSERIRNEVGINLTAVIECAQAVLPAMTARKSGHIINVASIAGLIGVPGSTVYSATKFGVNGFTDALHREMLDTGVRVSAFCPGYTPSEISTDLKAHAEGQPNAPRVPGLMPIAYVADQVARLIQRPRLRMVIPPSWKILVVTAYFFPGLADALISLFRPAEK
jgi:short-subunit dehydrogenase